MVKRICKTCKKEYDAFSSTNKYFCSFECFSKSKVKGHFAECAQCKKEIWVYPSSKKRFCSKSCARTFANLTPKNPAYKRDISGDKNPMYGRGRSGAANPMYGMRGEKCKQWKGGIRKRKDGYIRVIAPSGHPHPSDTKNDVSYILQHRLVMEQSIGRYLSPEEVVHHINNDPSDNRIENLQLFANQREHMIKGHGKKVI